MKILIIDDVEINCDILQEFLSKDYELLMTGNGETALEILEKNEIALILLDLEMPKVNGYEVMTIMKEKGWLDRVPVIVIGGENVTESEKRSLELGAVDFIRKPFDRYIVRRRVQNTMALFDYQHSLEKQVECQNLLLKEKNERLLTQAGKIKGNNQRIIDVLGTVVEYRNLESGAHIRRVKEFTQVLANSLMEMFPEYGLTKEQTEMIVAASPLHDIGKICIPDSILMKPGRLTAEEFGIMKTHAEKGAVLIQNIQGAWENDYGKACYEICRSHHERWDGKGYPDGLAEDDIPLSAQIVAVADVYDALISKRCYKDACSLKDAMKMIVSGECGIFSENIIDCFRREIKKLETIAMKYV